MMENHTQQLARNYVEAAIMARDNARYSRRLAKTGLKLMSDPIAEATAAYRRGLGYIDLVRRFQSHGVNHDHDA